MDYTTKTETPKPRKKAKPVIKSDRVVSSKESLAKKIIKSFFEDDIQDIKKYLLWEKIIPGAKNLILDGLEKLFFKEVRGSRGNRRGSGYDYNKTSYSYYYNGSEKKSEKKKEESQEVDCRHVVLQYRDDAEKLVRTLKQYIREDGEVSVATMFDLIDSPSDYIDYDWGWDDERDIGYRRVSDGYLIDVREPKYLGKR